MYLKEDRPELVDLERKKKFEIGKPHKGLFLLIVVWLLLPLAAKIRIFINFEADFLV